MNNPFIDPNFKSIFNSKSTLSKLLLANIFIFIFIQFIHICFYLFNINSSWNEALGISKTIYWLGLPSDIDLLMVHPWSVISYMFLHESFFHLLFNMLMLYMGGKLFISYLGTKKLIYTYIIGGLFGGIFYVASFNLFPAFENLKHFSIALGASASVLAILVGIATYIPNYNIHLMFFGKIKFVYLVLILAALDVLSIVKGNPGGHLAHLGGAAWGFISIWAFRKGIFKKKVRSRVKYKTPKTKSQKPKRPLSDDEYNTIKQDSQKKIDAILDTISKKGYDAISKEEKDFLFNYKSK